MDENKDYNENFTQLVETVRRMETDLQTLMDWYNGKETEPEAQARILAQQEFKQWAEERHRAQMQEEKDAQSLKELFV